MHTKTDYPYLPYETAKELLGRVNTLLEPIGFQITANFNTTVLPFPKKDPYSAVFEAIKDSSPLLMGIKMNKGGDSEPKTVIIGSGIFPFNDADPTRMIACMNDLICPQRFPVVVYPRIIEQPLPEQFASLIGRWRFDPQTNKMVKWEGD